MRAALTVSAICLALYGTAYSPLTTEIRDLILQLENHDETTRIQAADRLRDLGTAANSATHALLDAADQQLGAAQLPYLSAAASVSPGHRTVVQLLAIAAALEDPLSANLYLDLLGEMGHRAASSVPFLIEILRSPHPLRAEQALARIGLPAAQAMLAVLRETDDPVATGRIVRTLHRLGSHPDAPQIVPLLTQLLRSGDQRLQYAGLRALGGHGQHASGSVPAIEAMVLAADDPKALPPVACSALANMGAPAVPALAVIATLAQEPVQILAILTIRDMGPIARGAVPTLERLQSSKLVAVQQAAREALPRIQ
ncbi:MAG TPA: hypothetical protein DCR55_01195 [Lentisphaeria bacterium]|nr:hypothetical protein [Lentisphaeria bacterium]